MPLPAAKKPAGIPNSTKNSMPSSYAANDRVGPGRRSAHNAQQSARREFGNVALVQQVTPRPMGHALFEEFASETYATAARMLPQNPAFSLAVPYA